MLNAITLALCAAAYLLNQALLKGTSVPFFTNHLNDVLAGVIILAWSDMLARSGSREEAFIRSPLGGTAIIAIASIAWEGVAPMFIRWSVGDPWDVLAYAVGGVIQRIAFMAHHANARQKKEINR